MSHLATKYVAALVATKNHLSPRCGKIQNEVIRMYNIDNVSVKWRHFSSNDDFWQIRTDINEVKSVKMSSIDVKWRQGLWGFRVFEIWHGLRFFCQFMTFFELFENFIFKKFQKKFCRNLTIYDECVETIDVKQCQITSIELIFIQACSGGFWGQNLTGNFKIIEEW